MSESPTQLKEWFNEDRYVWLADQLKALAEGFDRKKFLRHVLDGLSERELLARLRRTTEALHESIPGNYACHLELLSRLAPIIAHSFVGILPCDYVGLYGRKDFDRSMQALAQFTCFGSGEFAVREFLRDDLDRALSHMKTWARDKNEHVRRLASEGSRPRLPWSFQLKALIKDPSPTLPILTQLRSDPSLYVRKSVANHLNDISKDHPDVMLDLLESWPLDDPHTAWIARHASRTLIKAGDPRTLALFGVSHTNTLSLRGIRVTPRSISIGERCELKAELHSESERPETWILDFRIHYVRPAGRGSSKTFKGASGVILPGDDIPFRKTLHLAQRSTRSLFAGTHRIEFLLNGKPAGECELKLRGTKTD